MDWVVISKRVCCRRPPLKPTHGDESSTIPKSFETWGRSSQTYGRPQTLVRLPSPQASSKHRVW